MERLTINHRPWPVPEGPWIMRQAWHDLLFAHWPVPAQDLQSLVPEPLQVGIYNGWAWLGIVPFHIRGLRARGLPPLPGLSAFPELNVRTYVTHQGKPGVWFFSLDAASTMAVWAARWSYHLPYFRADMTIGKAGETVFYFSRRRSSLQPELRMWYRPNGPVFNARPGSLEHWLTERHCLYAADNAGRLYRAEIHHNPWPLQTALGEIQRNTMAEPLNVPLPSTAPLLHFSNRQEVIVWWPRPADRPGERRRSPVGDIRQKK
jgi:uncharacterized protein